MKRYYRIQEAGLEPVIAASEKRGYQMVLHEVKPGWTITNEWGCYTIEAEIAFADVREDEYLGILFFGGRAPEYIRYNDNLVRITRHLFRRNRPIAGVCHGVEIAGYACCVVERRLATLPKCKFDLEVCGSIFINESCVTDGDLVSGRTCHHNGRYIGPWIKLLEATKEKYP